MTVPRAGIFGYASKNLGDDMQSIAALALLNRVDAILSRDLIHETRCKQPITCIFNSWFKQGELRRPPTRSVDPLMYGVAVGKPEMLDGPWSDYFSNHSAVGCRDRHTARLFRSRGMEAYFTGCLTLQLGRRMQHVPDEEREGVLVVDVDEAWLEQRFDPAVWDGAEFVKMDIGRVRRRPFSRLKLISDRLRRLARARLIITRRLHVGSPASSLGTTVILLPERGISKANERFSGFEELLRFTYQDELPAGMRHDAESLKNSGVRAHEGIDKAYLQLQETLAARGLLAEGPLSWDYPERLLFRFDVASWPPDAVLFARCGWAEQALAMRARQGDIIEASLPGFLAYDRFRLTFFLETPEGRERKVVPLPS